MQDVIETVDKHIDQFAITAESQGDFTELAKRWASHSLSTYRDELLNKALNISKALVDFDAELFKEGS